MIIKERRESQNMTSAFNQSGQPTDSQNAFVSLIPDCITLSILIISLSLHTHHYWKNMDYGLISTILIGITCLVIILRNIGLLTEARRANTLRQKELDIRLKELNLKHTLLNKKLFKEDLEALTTRAKKRYDSLTDKRLEKYCDIAFDEIKKL